MVNINWNTCYHKIRQPGESFTLNQWMQTVYSFKELWLFSVALWKQRNMKLHGIDGAAISMEQWRKETMNEAVGVVNN
jgi:hypothetical protein